MSAVLDRVAIARIVIGPREPVPATSKYTLQQLQDIRFGLATDQERSEALWIADAILASFPALALTQGNPL